MKYDASHKSLGASLEQLYPNGWFPIAYASRFPNTAEQKYSTNELELLAVVWSTEHFRYYLYGSEFDLVTDHKALLSALKTNRGKKSRHSRLTRWVDILLPFKFKIHHKPGKKMGLVQSQSPPTEVSKDDKLLIANRIKEFNFTPENDFRRFKLLANKNAAQFNTSHSDDVINHAHNARTKQSSFCLNHTNLQLPSIHSISNSKLSLRHYNSIKLNSPINHIKVITRQNSNRETFETVIRRDKEAPTKQTHIISYSN